MHSAYESPSRGFVDGDARECARVAVGVARSYEMDSKLSCQMMRDLVPNVLSESLRRRNASDHTHQISCRRFRSSGGKSLELGSWCNPRPWASRIVKPGKRYQPPEALR